MGRMPIFFDVPLVKWEQGLNGDPWRKKISPFVRWPGTESSRVRCFARALGFRHLFTVTNKMQEARRRNEKIAFACCSEINRKKNGVLEEKAPAQ
jgi:hypothetical protein